MAKRICICPITPGLPGHPPPGDTNRPSVADSLGAGGGYNTVIPTKVGGSPKHVRCPTQFVTTDLPTVAALTNVLLFPDYPFDSALSGMGQEVRDAFIQNVEAVDIDGLGTHLSLAGYALSDSYGALVLRILQQFEPAFQSLATFDVRDV